MEWKNINYLNSFSTDGVEYTDFWGLASFCVSGLCSNSSTSVFEPNGWCEQRESKLNVLDVEDALRLGFRLEDAEASDNVELRRRLMPRLCGLWFSSISIVRLCLDSTCLLAVSERLFLSRFLWIGTVSFIIANCGSNVTDPCDPCAESICCLKKKTV